jgi:hypothetical protein
MKIRMYSHVIESRWWNASWGGMLPVKLRVSSPHLQRWRIHVSHISWWIPSSTFSISQTMRAFSMQTSMSSTTQTQMGVANRLLPLRLGLDPCPLTSRRGTVFKSVFFNDFTHISVIYYWIKTVLCVCVNVRACTCSCVSASVCWCLHICRKSCLLSRMFTSLHKRDMNAGGGPLVELG